MLRRVMLGLELIRIKVGRRREVGGGGDGGDGRIKAWDLREMAFET